MVHAESLTPSLRYDWSNVAMGGAGFVSGVFAHSKKAGLFYVRTDVGVVYRFNPANDFWVPLLDWLPPDRGSHMGIEALALDPGSSSEMVNSTSSMSLPASRRSSFEMSNVVFTPCARVTISISSPMVVWNKEG